MQVLDCGQGFLFASSCEVNALRVVLRELQDGLFSETDVAFAEDKLDTAVEKPDSRHTTSHKDHLSCQRRDILLRVERYPAWEDPIQHRSSAN